MVYYKTFNYSYICTKTYLWNYEITYLAHIEGVKHSFTFGNSSVDPFCSSKKEG